MRHTSRTPASLIRASLLASIAVSAMVLPSAAFAQQAAAAAAATAEEDTGNDIIVTASKRTATLQDTPISVSVTTKAVIEQAQIRDLKDLQTLVPSLRVNQLQSSANTNFIIRGFGNGANNVGIEPSVGVFIDGVYRSRSAAQIGDLPNLERVEVLRGPQSTLFGKNASAGIISIVTSQPKFELGGSAEFSYGNYNAIVAKADITGPLTDKIAFSLAGNINKRDGYARDLNLGIKTNERDRWGVRGQLLFKLSDDFKIRLIGDYDNIDENCCIAVNLVDGPTGNAVRALGGKIDSANPFSYNSFGNIPSSNKIKNYGFSGEVNWNLNDTLALTSVSAYRAVRALTNQDSDFTSADLIGSNVGDVKIDTYTTELRLASSFDGPLNFLAGAFYFHENIKNEQELLFGRDFRNYANLLAGGNYTLLERVAPALFPAGTFGKQGTGRNQKWTQKDNSYSIFGQLDFEPLDGLVFTAGGNYTSDSKAVSSKSVYTDAFSALDLAAIGNQVFGIPAAFANNPAVNPLLGLRALQFIPPFLDIPNVVESGKTKDNDFSYTLRAAYKINRSLSTYATYATGFKASSFNISTDSRPFPTDFIPGPTITNPPASPIRTAGLALNNLTTGTRFAKPENAEVFEVGVKGQFDGFGFNLALFKQSLKNFQNNIFTGTGFVLGNAEKQSTLGIELDASISPVKNLNFTANFTYLRPKFDLFTGGSALNANFGTTPTDLTGQTPAGIPKFAFSLAANYTHVFSDDVKATFHVDFADQSAVQIAQGNPLKREEQSLNAAVSLAVGHGVEVTVWGRNISDVRYITTIFPSVAQAGSLSGYPNQPRTWGGSIRYRF